MKLNQFPEYCVVIRTLGKAGGKYYQELCSLTCQTVPPKRILVYIAHGYEIPKETVGCEEYIYCEKGMMTQRSLPFTEVDTDWILFLDDDIYIPEDGVERLFTSLKEYHGDCISPDTFEHVHGKASLRAKIFSMLFNQEYPHCDKKCSLKIRKDGGISYINHPVKDVLSTQYVVGNCILCRKLAYMSVNMAAERWIDTFQYAMYEDFLFSYKIFKSGYKMLMQYNSGIIHLDAQSGHAKNIVEENLTIRTLRFITWWRMIYSTQKSFLKRFQSVIAFSLRMLLSLSFHLFLSIVKAKPYLIVNSIKSLYLGWKFVHSPAYLSYPPFLSESHK